MRDIDKAFDQVKDLGIIVDTTSAGPVYTQRPRNNTRAVMMRDPDGFVFEFVQAGAPPQTDVPATSNIYNARSSLAIDNFDKSLAFYRDLLGFTFANTPNDINDAVLALEGTPRARARTSGRCRPARTTCGCSGSSARSSGPSTCRTCRIPAHRRSRSRSRICRRCSRMKTAGIVVETAGGAPVALVDGRRAALVRSPDGLLIELVEPASSQAAR